MAKAQRRGNMEAKKSKEIKDSVAAPATLSRGVLATGIASPKAKKS